MAGIYLHIPYCKQACIYCNFHFSTSLSNKAALLQAMHKEIELRSAYLNQEIISSIYFGGGTPSLLSILEINNLLERIRSTQQVSPNAEITFEVNPDDLHAVYLEQLKNAGVNRLSIGVQSFFDADMKYMHRAHTAAQSFEAIEESIRAGFQNISIDLIYGIPDMTLETWNTNIQYAIDYSITHLSCYALTVEPRTQLHHLIAQGKTKAPDDQETISQFEFLINRATSSGYEHYEISNFAKPGYESRHNSSYWSGIPYLGIGPAAHSFRNHERQWNVANNQKYVELLSSKQKYFEMEDLDPIKRYNEFILTRIRTSRGILASEIPMEYYNHFMLQIKPFLEEGTVVYDGKAYILSLPGKFIADKISMELFFG